ncbi:TPA: hypothetical protein MYL91_000631 [Klebsiella pneumoniae]|uniref:hypothetical protein n=1 Tax=Klebsiella pneumoniae TaxID=573 RepID=UPI00190C9E5B|nr:hypothetical protein [Klebsiella pneumoniae]HCB0142403.1 hypothetical protein [Klebsiella pneumoniae]HCB0242420.1 hypothetical protein [Klebsiella pneumoniae]HCB0289034.1 hypothetical protein [Klebsiella pneumoniae]HCB0683027.1 hypothetical protein [Klebsiella pneumoniae]
MTKSTITRERIEQYANDPRMCNINDEIRELARIALAAMDSEPVAWTWQHLKQWHVTNDEARARDLAWDGVKVEPLYRHAQPAPVVPEEMTPEMMRSVQLNSELGAYAASNLSGAYDLFAEFWKVACRAAMLIGGKP